MTVCQSPPGRTSSVQAGTVQPFGPHHLAICAGAVKARNTRPRGAAKLRDRRNTRASFVFGWAIVINLAYTALEAGYGFHANSLALLSDALHNLGDVLGLGLAWGAAKLAQRPPTNSHTYGWRRATLL